jgi:hypothetical protein
MAPMDSAARAGSLDPGQTGERSGVSRWFAAGAAAWLGLALLHTVAGGFQNLAADLPFYTSWRQVADRFVDVLAGAALSPLVIIVLRKLRAEPRSVVVLAAVYLLTGIAYWVLWAGVRLLYARQLTPELAEALPAVDHFLRILVFTALAALTLYTAMALLFEAVWYRGEVRRRELEGALLQLRLDQARTTALRAQVDSVFLRDAFDVASDLMASDVPGARKVLSDLSELLRVALGRNGAHSIDLRRELDLADRFIGIRQARREKPVPFELRIDEAAYGAAVPPLLMQPLLTAAFDWIAQSCEDDGRIVVAARAVGREVLLAVTAGCPAGSGRVQPRVGREDVEKLRRQLGGLHGDRTELTVVPSRTGGLELRVRVPLAHLDPR